MAQLSHRTTAINITRHRTEQRTETQNLPYSVTALRNLCLVNNYAADSFYRKP